MTDILAVLFVVFAICALCAVLGYLATLINKPEHEWIGDEAFRLKGRK